MVRQVAVCAPAKINLTLDITGRREDGYHFMRMVMQSVSLCDQITLARAEKPGIQLLCDVPGLPLDGRNLAWRAAERFLDAIGRPGDGLVIGLHKRIPMQAGLAGGSADAAGVLRGLDALYETRFSQARLCDLALPLGADVPFCLVGGAVLAEGIGELFTPLPSLQGCYIVIAKPAEGVSTAEAFARFDREGSCRVPDTDEMAAAVAAGNLPEVGLRLCNVLEEVSLLPQVAQLRNLFAECGALGSVMTGSGSAVFGLFAEKRAARRCYLRLRGAAQAVFLTQPIDRGAYLLAKR